MGFFHIKTPNNYLKLTVESVRVINHWRLEQSPQSPIQQVVSVHLPSNRISSRWFNTGGKLIKYVQNVTGSEKKVLINLLDLGDNNSKDSTPQSTRKSVRWVILLGLMGIVLTFVAILRYLI